MTGKVTAEGKEGWHVGIRLCGSMTQQLKLWHAVGLRDVQPTYSQAAVLMAADSQPGLSNVPPPLRQHENILAWHMCTGFYFNSLPSYCVYSSQFWRAFLLWQVAAA